MKGESLPLTGTGEETRDFTYVNDLIDGLLRAGYYDGAIGKEFNLASGKETKIIDLANRISDLTGNKAGINFLSRRKWDTKSRLLASVDRAKTLVGYVPKTEFDEGLKRTVEWFKEKWDLIEQAASFGPGMTSAVRDKDTK